MRKKRDGEQPLPSGWEECYDFDGKVFYTDHNTRQTSWIDPRDRLTKPHTFIDCGSDELPLGWEQAYDPSVGVYFIDHINKTNCLDDPRLQYRQQQQEMLHDYLATAHDDIAAKKEIYSVKEQRLNLAVDESQRLADALAALKFSNTSLNSTSSSGSTKYDPDLLKLDVADAHNRVSRLKKELELVRSEVQYKQNGLGALSSVNNKMSSMSGGYSVSEVKAIMNEIRRVQESLDSGQHEKQSLMQSLALLKNEFQERSGSGSSPDVSTLSLLHERSSSSTQTDLRAEFIPPGALLAEMSRVRLQYDETKRKISVLKQRLANIEDEMVPGQLESDRDRLLLIQEKEQLLRELRSIDLKCRSSETLAVVHQRIYQLEADLNHAVDVSNKHIAETLKLEEEKCGVLQELSDATRLTSYLESQLRSMSLSTLSISSGSSLGSMGSLSASSRGSLNSMSYTDIHKQTQKMSDIHELHSRVEKLLQGHSISPIQEIPCGVDGASGVGVAGVYQPQYHHRLDIPPCHNPYAAQGMFQHVPLQLNQNPLPCGLVMPQTDVPDQNVCLSSPHDYKAGPPPSYEQHMTYTEFQKSVMPDPYVGGGGVSHYQHPASTHTTNLPPTAAGSTSLLYDMSAPQFYNDATQGMIENFVQSIGGVPASQTNKYTDYEGGDMPVPSANTQAMNTRLRSAYPVNNLNACNPSFVHPRILNSSVYRTLATTDHVAKASASRNNEVVNVSVSCAPYSNSDISSVSRTINTQCLPHNQSCDQVLTMQATDVLSISPNTMLQCYSNTSLSHMQQVTNNNASQKLLANQGLHHGGYQSALSTSDNQKVNVYNKSVLPSSNHPILKNIAPLTDIKENEAKGPAKTSILNDIGSKEQIISLPLYAPKTTVLSRLLCESQPHYLTSVAQYQTYTTQSSQPSSAISQAAASAISQVAPSFAMSQIASATSLHWPMSTTDDAYNNPPLSPISETSSGVGNVISGPNTRSISAAVSDESVAGDSGVFDAIVTRTYEFDNELESKETAQVELKLEYDSAIGKLHVGIEQARHLNALPFSRGAQVFIKVALLPPASKPFMSRAIPNLIDPRFDETFFVTIASQVLSSTTLQIQVCQHNTSGIDESLGSTHISLTDIDMTHCRAHWYNVLSFTFIQAEFAEDTTKSSDHKTTTARKKSSLSPKKSNMDEVTRLLEASSAKLTKVVHPHSEVTEATKADSVLCSSQMTTSKAESSDESTIISSQTSTLTRNHGDEMSCSQVEDTASSDDNDDYIHHSDDYARLVRQVVEEFEEVLFLAEEEITEVRENDRVNLEIEKCDQETNTDLHYPLSSPPRIKRAQGSRRACTLRRSQTFSPTGRGQAYHDYVCKLTRSDSDSSIPLYTRRSLQRHSLERRSLRLKRPSVTPTMYALPPRTSLDLELDLQATHTKLAHLNEEISRLKEIKSRLEDLKANGDKRLPSWITDNDQFQQLLTDADKLLKRDHSNYPSKQDRRAEKLLRKVTKEVQMMRRRNVPHATVHQFREKMAYFTSANISVPAVPSETAVNESVMSFMKDDRVGHEV